MVILRWIMVGKDKEIVEIKVEMVEIKEIKVVIIKMMMIICLID
jgi:hypothetical protein